MQARWTLLLLPSFLVSMLLVLGPQLLFLRGSLYEDLGSGLLGTTLTAINYAYTVTDPFYRGSFALTVYVSALVVVASLVLAYPAGYILARMRSRLATYILALTVISAFVSIVIKVLGLFIIFGAEGPFNKVLLFLRVLDIPIHILGTNAGVVIGIMHYVLAFMILVLYSVIRTIPRELEEAAQVHGRQPLARLLARRNPPQPSRRGGDLADRVQPEHGGLRLRGAARRRQGADPAGGDPANDPA